jgi:transmembrane sensor
MQFLPLTKLFTGWKDGKLIFHKTPFEEVVKRLERWYDIDCIISDDAVKKEHFTSVFKDEPLLHVLDVIALSMNISYEIENQTINFKTDNL